MHGIVKPQWEGPLMSIKKYHFLARSNHLKLKERAKPKRLKCSSRALNAIWGILELRLLARSEDVLIGGSGKFN